MRRILPLAVALVLLAVAPITRAQTADDSADKNAKQARAALDAMIQAMGGQAWLNVKNRMQQGHVAGFDHGDPGEGTTDFWDTHAWPDEDRIEFTKHRDVVQFYLGRQAWEVTYRGKKPLPDEQVVDYLRRRDHSIETVIKTWLNDPKTILVYDGKRMAERHFVDQVTLISSQNESVTIQMDIETHLPFRRTFEWRDPVFKDKNLDAEEYDDYHTFDGIPTPFTITRFKNNEIIRQYFLTHVTYNQQLPADFWSVDAADKRIKK